MNALLSMIRRSLPEWHRQAECSGEPIEVFFPVRGGSTRRAYELCGRCPVRESCLAEALADPDAPDAPEASGPGALPWVVLGASAAVGIAALGTGLAAHGLHVLELWGYAAGEEAVYLCARA